MGKISKCVYVMAPFALIVFFVVAAIISVALVGEPDVRADDLVIESNASVGTLIDVVEGSKFQFGESPEIQFSERPSTTLFDRYGISPIVPFADKYKEFEAVECDNEYTAYGIEEAGAYLLSTKTRVKKEHVVTTIQAVSVWPPLGDDIPDATRVCLCTTPEEHGRQIPGIFNPTMERVTYEHETVATLKVRLAIIDTTLEISCQNE